MRAPRQPAVEAQRCAVLYPAIAEVARRAGAEAIGLIDLGGPAGPTLEVDRIGIAYDAGPTLGDPTSPVRLTARVVGGRPVPARALPEVAARIAVDRGGDVTEAIGRVPAGTLPVVITTWVLSRSSLEERARFLQRVQDAAAHRPVAWVSVEGVGVAPAVPTFGDRRASGHSIIGLALADHTGLQVESVGRCWSRGRILSWLADQP